jgi:phage repressor protein C with HTH and peptisase S24 domain
MKQEDVWRGIDILANEVGITPSRLAKMSGLDQAVFSIARRERGDGSLRWPSMHSLAKVLETTDLTIGDFVNYMYANPATRAGFKLPVLSMRAREIENQFDADGSPVGSGWRRMEFPDLQDPQCFGLTIDTDDYVPFFREGDMIVCAPGLSLRRRNRVVYKRAGAPEELFIGSLLRQTPFTIDLGSLDETASETVPASEIQWMAKIVWVRQ